MFAHSNAAILGELDLALPRVVFIMNPREFATSVLVKIAKFMTQGSGDIEEVYYSIDRLGSLWIVLVRAMAVLNIDKVILAPAGSKLVPIPLFMSSSERSVRDVFKPNVGDIVVDVGTYYGRYTLIASEYVGDSGLVVGIEADFHNYKTTKKNVEMNKAKNVVLVWSAASNHEGIIRLYKGDKPGTHSLVWDVRTMYEDVPCKTIDNLLHELGINRVDWLKIDVEGAELMVLEGSRQTLAENERLKLVIEIHTGSDEVFRFLEKLHYRVKFLEPKGNTPFHIFASKDTYKWT